ncbi:class I SAM-dependent methyltransferase [Kribbella qitaiheensis]|uniref:Class I SAM-dependent methyltransferase n=1 Tax=Kribbella qitaiheensis TaxID=1544730 RepID=A0A7G6X6A2_9ACTN|nr:class I SAM-dependent methyltransferase [Kribbella qitaiheensis]QNE21767.1 class I SAM-dependent methyltransferase [Kribbella qitaiheensis]
MGRLELRKTFGEDAELYDRVRPTYPPGLYDDLTALLGNTDRPRVLEIGCGTGQATRPMLERGWSVKAVELSPELSGVARANLPGLEVITTDFDVWPLPAEKFDLVISATAFHWLDPETRVIKSADALRPGGVLAVVSTHHVAGRDPFFGEVQECYQQFMPGTDKEEKLLAPDEVPADSSEIDASGRFGPVEFRRYVWDQTYTTAEYLDLLNSYSGHRALTTVARDRLYDCIGARIEAAGGSVTKSYLTQLSAANCLNQPLASS